MSIVHVASYMISYAQVCGLELTQMQLQKLLFLTEIEGYRRYEKSILKGTKFTAFDHGPVVKTLYPYVSEIGSLPLSPFVSEYEHEIDDELKGTIEFVVNKYARYSASYLRNYTHHFYSWKDHFQEDMPASKIKEDARIINEAVALADEGYNRVKDLILD